MILITIKVLNIGTDRSDPDKTAPNYEQSDQGLHCFVIPPASVYGFTAIKKKGDVYINNLTAYLLLIKLFESISIAYFTSLNG